MAPGGAEMYCHAQRQTKSTAVGHEPTTRPCPEAAPGHRVSPVAGSIRTTSVIAAGDR